MLTADSKVTPSVTTDKAKANETTAALSDCFKYTGHQIFRAVTTCENDTCKHLFSSTLEIQSQPACTLAKN